MSKKGRTVNSPFQRRINLSTRKTVLKLDNVVFKDALDKDIFTVRRLEKGL
ncbi:hypothetical protein VU12_05805 [Desulfobulbus sp. US4]|nr:hypothetical protein [Desulfobulbus sp. US4]